MKAVHCIHSKGSYNLVKVVMCHKQYFHIFGYPISGHAAKRITPLVNNADTIRPTGESQSTPTGIQFRDLRIFTLLDIQTVRQLVTDKQSDTCLFDLPLYTATYLRTYNIRHKNHNSLFSTAIRLEFNASFLKAGYFINRSKRGNSEWYIN